MVLDIYFKVDWELMTASRFFSFLRFLVAVLLGSGHNKSM